jgi:magnesium chelatase family protein
MRYATLLIYQFPAYDMYVREIRHSCKVQEKGERLVQTAMSQLNLSTPAYHRILTLARTIADLAAYA